MDGFRHTGWQLLLVAAVLAAACPAAAGGRASTAGELETVRARIAELLDEFEAATSRRGAAERELRTIEKNEQRVRRDLQAARNQVAAARTRQAELRAQEQRQQATLQAARAELGRALRLAYINGPEERLRLALSEQDAALLGRHLIYAGYVARQRSADIRGFQAQVAELQRTQEQLTIEVAGLAELEARAAARLAEVAAVRGQRAELLAAISADLATRDTEIARLRAEEEELARLLESLRSRLPARVAEGSEPFAGQAASLSWPAAGPLLKRFGDPRADGSLKWTGVLVGAPAGAEVRAVYHGRVVFADWLSGMGLLTIVEHDGGYMSLYGHNQDLLKTVGEWVSPGEPIAHVGDSGGQANAGLYFEIRKDGEPVNPQRWIVDP
ncbi:MAG: peptidoglycan DD-metalloendopeptidase family protein [Gammaproteobacteria bacterium]|jgi:septal ring factor EnvC (AmiA/AmiB activator)|nr:peptidoglycan DD-metalloendopeptidase family protein [Gammaproteobacteria bacterium]